MTEMTNFKQLKTYQNVFLLRTLRKAKLWTRKPTSNHSINLDHN